VKPTPPRNQADYGHFPRHLDLIQASQSRPPPLPPHEMTYCALVTVLCHGGHQNISIIIRIITNTRCIGIWKQCRLHLVYSGTSQEPFPTQIQHLLAFLHLDQIQR
jgi:hypothetical protein